MKNSSIDSVIAIGRSLCDASLNPRLLGLATGCRDHNHTGMGAWERSLPLRYAAHPGRGAEGFAHPVSGLRVYAGGTMDYVSSTFSAMPTSEIFSAGISTLN